MAEKLGARSLKPVATATKLSLALPDFETPARRLAASLEEFGGNVTRLAVRKTQEHAKAQEEKGRIAGAEATARGRGTLEEMVEDGIISRGANPFFRDGVLVMAGKARADAFNEALTVAYAEEVPTDSTDPQAMDALVERVAGQFTNDDDDPALLDGFAERAGMFVAQHGERHARVVASNLEGLNDELLGTRFRGMILDAVQSAPGALVENVLTDVQEFADEWMAEQGQSKGAIRNARRKMNKALVDAVEGAVTGGSLNGLQAREVLEGIKTHGKETLWSNIEHAERIQEAIDKRAARVQVRYQRDLAVVHRRHQAAEAEATATAWAGASANGGLLNLDHIREALAQPGGAEQFSPDYLEDMVRLADNIEAEVQKNYRSDRFMLNETLAEVLDPDTTFTEDSIRGRIGLGRLNPQDAAMLIDRLQFQKNQSANDPTSDAMWRDAFFATNQALGGFTPNQFTTQAMITARGELLDGFNEFRTKNPDATVRSPEYAEWLKTTTDAMQTRHLSPGEAAALRGRVAMNIAQSETAIYREKLFEPDSVRLVRLYAEATLMQTNPSHIPSDDLLDFFGAEGRQLSEDAAMDPTSYVAGLAGQLALANVNLGSGSVKEAIANYQDQFRQR